MTGNLNMSDNLIKGLPTNYPPLYVGDEAPSWTQTVDLVNDQDVVAKSYADNKFIKTTYDLSPAMAQGSVPRRMVISNAEDVYAISFNSNRLTKLLN